MLIFELDFFLYFVDKKNLPRQYEIHHGIELSMTCDLLLAISITFANILHKYQ